MKKLTLLMIIPMWIFASQEAVVLPPKTVVTVSGVKAFQNRCTATVYWVKGSTAEFKKGFTSSSSEKELGLGGAEISFIHNSSYKCTVVVEK